MAEAQGRHVEGRLAENILYFARALRAAGIPVGSGSVLDALEAVNVAHVVDREDFYWTLHAVFVKRHEHSILFDQAFRIFFRKRGYIEKLIASMLPEAKAKDHKAPPPGAQRIQEALFSGLDKPEDKSEVEINASLTVSDREILQKKDFAQMSAAEIAAAKQAIARLALPLDMLRTRRMAPSRRGHLIDIRRTLRASMKAGGAVIDLKYLGPREKEPPIVALLDISGSMSQYTRLFLHFLHAVSDERKRVTTFLFGTRLTNVTRLRSSVTACRKCRNSRVYWLIEPEISKSATIGGSFSRGPRYLRSITAPPAFILARSVRRISMRCPRRLGAMRRVRNMSSGSASRAIACLAAAISAALICAKSFFCKISRSETVRLALISTSDLSSGLSRPEKRASWMRCAPGGGALWSLAFASGNIEAISFSI